jgi:hypothetical protein
VLEGDRRSAQSADSGLSFAVVMTTASRSVRSKIRYTSDAGGYAPEVYFYEPDPGTVVHPPGNDPREVDIHDAWPRAAECSVDVEGFQLTEVDASFEKFEDAQAVDQILYPRAAALVKQTVGAKRVHVFDHTVRSKANQAKETTIRREPVMVAHGDYTPDSGPLRVRQLLGNDADQLLARRVAFYNIWMPVRNPVEEKPLAMCDARYAPHPDLIRMILRYRDRNGEIFVLRYSPKHRWWYFPRMQVGQALLLKTYDSETDGRARFMVHSAFDDPTTPAGCPTRESVEIRTMAFF